MNDKFTNGFFAGVAGGFATIIWGITIDFFIKSITLTFVDTAAIIVYSRKPGNFLEYILAMLIQLIFSGFFGAFFAYLLPVLSQKNYLFKGWLYGIFVWFLIYGAMSLYQIKGLINVPVQTVLSNLVNASLYGLIMAIVLKWLVKDKNPR